MHVMMAIKLSCVCFALPSLPIWTEVDEAHLRVARLHSTMSVRASAHYLSMGLA